MKTKSEQLYGSHHFTALEAEWEMLRPDSSGGGKALFATEDAIADNYNGLRRVVKNLLRELTDVDARLEHNAAQGDVDLLLLGVNSLGVVQGRGGEIDSMVKAIHALAKVHKAITRKAPTKEKQG